MNKKLLTLLASSSFVLPIVALSAGCKDNSNKKTINFDGEMAKINVDVQDKNRLDSEVKANEIIINGKDKLSAGITASAKIKKADGTNLIVTVSLTNSKETKSEDKTIIGFKDPTPVIDRAAEFAKISVDVKNKANIVADNVKKEDVDINISSPTRKNLHMEFGFSKKDETSIIVSVRLNNVYGDSKVREYLITGFMKPTHIINLDEEAKKLTIEIKDKANRYAKDIRSEDFIIHGLDTLSSGVEFLAANIMRQGNGFIIVNVVVRNNANGKWAYNEIEIYGFKKE